MTDDVILEVRDLVKTYRQGDTVIYPVRGQNLTVHKGEFLVIMGPSGAGKSTLLRLMAGLESPDAGRIRLCGQEITYMKYEQLAAHRRAHVGVVMQNCDLLPHLTVGENIALPLMLAGQKAGVYRVKELAEELGIADRLGHFPDEISGGQAQRAALARALIASPEILFLDEPTGNLDGASAADVADRLLRLNEKGVTAVMVTHDGALCRRITAEAHAGRMMEIR